MEISVKEMLEAGVHFGHQTSRWNPRMGPFIYGARNGIHIIDLQKTAKMGEIACAFITKLVSEGGDLLFVGTKRQAQPIVEEEARRCGMHYVNHRWLGGTLTNFRTIKASIDRLRDLEKKTAEGGFSGLTKKERLEIEREIQKLKKTLGGIQSMDRLPSTVFILDPNKEHIARKEAVRLEIPVVAVGDTNCDPEGIDYLIPGNDDALKSIRYFTHKIADACSEGVSLRETVMRQRVEDEGRGEGRTVREAVVAGKGKAFVSRPEAYEVPVGEYTSKQAETEGAEESKEKGPAETAGKPDEKPGEKK